MRYDLAFFLCCCKSFLGSDNRDDGEDFYALLGIQRDATPEEIKKAYKRKSLQMHPDKIAQSGRSVTKEDQARFTRMKEAYEVRVCMLCVRGCFCVVRTHPFARLSLDCRRRRRRLSLSHTHKNTPSPLFLLYVHMMCVYIVGSFGFTQERNVRCNR